jgi:major membrane immunogen (membrane-anchored lipoprotein)
MSKRIIVAVCLLLVAVSAFAAWKDGVYSAKDTPDKRTYVAELRITIAGGVITKIEYNEADKANKSKWTDKAYNANMKKIAGIAWTEAIQALQANLLKVQDVSKLDAVSGASETSERFKELAEVVLAKAK